MRKNVPDIRFKGFEDEWKNVPLHDISYKIRDKNIKREYSVVLTNSAELGVIDQRDFFDRNIANENNISAYYLVEQNDYVYNPRISTTAPVGPINRNKLGYVGVMSPLYYVFRLRNIDSMDFQYLDYFFKSSAWHSFMIENGNSGARSDRFSISDTIFSEMPISCPTEIDEQRKIGSFFTTLDNLINKLEQKLEKQRNIKQALLQKMFVDLNGDNSKPHIRLKGFDGDWKTIKLNKIAELVNRKNVNSQVSLPLTISAQYGLIAQTDFFKSRIAAKDVSGYYVIENGEFAYNRSTSDSSPYGAVKRLEDYDAGVLSTLYLVFKLKDQSVSSDFLVHYFNTDKWHSHIADCAAEGARNHGLLNISSEDFFNTPISKPLDIEEQRKIASLFTTLDNLNSKLEQKIQKLRNIKQALLRKMFVQQ
ncbi:MAG: restriction endonuclease subunit S [Prevotella sp.]|nr:restriction endonuclease subunit S [Prevotella sp.]